MIYPLSVQTPDVNTTTKKRTLYQKHKNVIAIEKRKTSGVWNQRIVYQSHIALKHPKGFRFGGEAEFVGQTRWCYHVLILIHGSIHFPRYATTFPAGPVKNTWVGQDFFLSAWIVANALSVIDEGTCLLDIGRLVYPSRCNQNLFETIRSGSASAFDSKARQRRW